MYCLWAVCIHCLWQCGMWLPTILSVGVAITNLLHQNCTNLYMQTAIVLQTIHGKKHCVNNYGTLLHACECRCPIFTRRTTETTPNQISVPPFATTGTTMLRSKVTIGSPKQNIAIFITRRINNKNTVH